MVEGHSVHRVATMHRQRLVGNRYVATSPNGRFAEGAMAIHNRIFYRIEAVGKNLFAFFGSDDDKDNAVVVHVHFGMAGNWAVYESDEDVPPPTATNRLRLTHIREGLTVDLSAMTVQHGGLDLYRDKRSKLGQDPLREDANVELLWTKVKKSKKSIGALIMDQSFFCGPGNIYRAEILFKAGIHPDTPGMALQREEFDLIWHHTVALLRRGYETGSILTVDPEEATKLGKPQLRRYIYNTKKCPRCGSRIQVWDIGSRTCYACPKCQPQKEVTDKVQEGPTKMGGRKASRKVRPVTPEKKDCIPFHSHCAPESTDTRLRESGPAKLTIKEIKAQLANLGVRDIPKNLRKPVLVQLLLDEQANRVGRIEEQAVVAPVATSSKGTASIDIVSSEAAAAEKALANESLAVEHIAELAPAQARRARAQVTKLLQNQKSTPQPRSRKRGGPVEVTPSPRKKRLWPN